MSAEGTSRDALRLASPTDGRASDCPDDNLLATFVGGHVSADERARIESHVDVCAACEELLARFAQAYVSSRPPPPSGAASIGRYVVGREIGRGTMGTVYEANDPILDRVVALKTLAPPDGAADFEARALQEARATARLAHPNVVAVFDAVVDHGRVCLAMELVKGPSLRAFLAATNATSTRRLALFREAALGLAAAHDAGVTHGDFRTANVLVGPSGARVTDFGLARLRDPAIVHAIAYASPERLASPDAAASTTPASDQFSFGVALYEALYRAHPFGVAGGEISRDALRASIAAGPRPPPDVELPAWVWPLVRRTLAVEPSDRFPSMHEVADELAGPTPHALTLLARLRVVLVGGFVLHALFTWSVAYVSLEPSPEPDPFGRRPTDLLNIVHLVYFLTWLFGGMALLGAAASDIVRQRRSAWTLAAIYVALAFPSCFGTPLAAVLLYFLTRPEVRRALGAVALRRAASRRSARLQLNVG